MLTRSFTPGLPSAAALVLALVGAGHAVPAATPAQDLREQIQALAHSVLLDDAVHGLSVVVELGGETLASVGQGVAGCDPEPASVRTRYAGGACLDLFFGLAAARLIERDELDLEAEVSSLLESFPFEDEPVTVAQLLSHTSGLPSLADLPPTDARAASAQEAPEAALLERLGALPMESTPGSCLEYSSGGVLVLGLVLEHASGLDAQTLVAREVLTPLGLSGTDFNGPESASDSHFLRFLGAERFSAETQPLPFGAENLCTTAPDLARVAAALSSDAHEETRELLAKSVSLDGKRHAFAHGLVTGKLEGHPFYSFGGSSESSAVQSAYYPDHQLAIAVCASEGDAPVERLERRIARLVYGIPEPGIRDEPLPEGAEETYVGEYLVGCNSHIIDVHAGRLRHSVPEGKAFALLYQGEHEFVSAVDPDVRLIFEVEYGIAKQFFLEEHGARAVGKRIQ